MLTLQQRTVIQEFQSHRDWFKKSYQVRFFPWSVQVHSIVKLMRKFPWAQHFGGTIGEPNGMQHWLWNEEDMVRVREVFIERTLKESDFLAIFESGFLSEWERFLEGEQQFLKQYNGQNLARMMPKVRRLIDLETNVGMYGYVDDCFLTVGEVDWLVNRIEKELPEDTANRESVIADLATPLTPSFVQEEHRDRLAIASAPRTQWPELLKAHTKKWHWAENSYWESESLTPKDFLEKVERLLAEHPDVTRTLKEIQDGLSQKKKRKEALYEKLHLSKELRKIIDLSDRISHLTDLRKQGVLRINGWIWKFLKDISKHTGQPFDLLTWMNQDEMEDMVEKKAWSVLEERRQNGMMLLIKEGAVIKIQGNDFLAVDISPFLGVKEGIRECKGQVACKGLAQGIARIIRGRADFHYFQDGNILITNQTTPEFVPLMKRASAVVTEQGGITCHAAIVSREFNIPCVIGVADAMKIFGNGEQIEVDANQGLARKL